MQAESQPELNGLIGQLPDLRNQSGSGNRDPACPEMQPPFGIQGTNGGYHVIVVGQRLTHSHEHDVVKRDGLLGRGGIPLPLLLPPIHNLAHLVHSCIHVAQETHAMLVN